MSVFAIPILAQANAAIDAATAGQVLSGMMVLLVMASSLAMIIVWGVRVRQTGHALPAAQRGVLRVPLPLTAVAVAMSVLIFLLTMFVSMEDQIIPPPVAAAPAAATSGTSTDPVSEESAAQKGTGSSVSTDDPKATSGVPESLEAATTEAATTEAATTDAATTDAATTDAAATDVATTDAATKTDSESAAASAATPSKMTPSQMKSALIHTVVMDIVLFLVFGVVVHLATISGRVNLPEGGGGLSMVSAVDSRNSMPFPSSSFWPDLDDASAIPQLPGYAVLGQRSIPQPPPVVTARGDSFYSSTRDDSLVDYAAVALDMDGEREERFSFLTELRYAGEVFLASYVPTTFLRVLVVLLTVGLMGEEPGQHPFLEMMQTGVGTTVMALIVLTAVLFAPVVEELQFRVVVLGGIAQTGRPMLALVASSILFAFAHGFPDSLALLPLAFALGYAYLRRRSYITVMLVHFLFNSFNMALALLALL